MQHIAIIIDNYSRKLGEKKFDVTESFFTFKNGTFNVRPDSWIYQDLARFYYIYVYNENSKISIEPSKSEKLKEKIESGDLKLLVGEHIIGQLARMAVQAVKTNWVMIILALGAGLGIGFMVCTAVNPMHIIYVNQTVGAIPTSPPKV